MMTQHRMYPENRTLDRGKYVFRDSPSKGGKGLWYGEQLRPQRRDVIICFRHMYFTEEFEELLRCDVPGIATTLFIGSPDSYEPSKIKGHKRKDVALVVPRPEGDHLGENGVLAPSEVVQLGLSLSDTIQLWATRASMTRGLRPETVYVVGKPGKRRFSGAIPQAYLFLGNSGIAPAFPYESYDPPLLYTMRDLDLDDVLFTVVMILWYAILGEHPYDVPGYPQIDDNTYNDIRRPFTGPPELGRLFERVLIADPDRRMKTAEFRDELEKLARAWNVELPPFPPPGLADP